MLSHPLTSPPNHTSKLIETIVKIIFNQPRLHQEQYLKFILKRKLRKMSTSDRKHKAQSVDLSSCTRFPFFSGKLKNWFVSSEDIWVEMACNSIIVEFILLVFLNKRFFVCFFMKMIYRKLMFRDFICWVIMD
jgi:hypothetical protein